MLLSLLCLVGAVSWNAQSLINPKVSRLCNKYGSDKPEEQWVCNPDEILSAATVQSINGKIATMNRETYSKDCNGGIEMAVVVISQMSSEYDGTLEGASRFAKKIHNDWGVGRRECQNGVVFFMSIQDRHYYISTGEGVKNILTVKAVEHFAKVMKDKLRDHKYDEAVEEMLDHMIFVLKNGEFDTGISPNISDMFTLQVLIRISFGLFWVLVSWAVISFM